MKINGNEVRIGHVLEHLDKLWTVVKTEHVKPGKGPAYLQAELKCLTDGTKLNERFRASETVERARLEQKNFQYLYRDAQMLTFMDTESYEQVELTTTLIGDDVDFLQDGMDVVIEYHEDTPLKVTLPDTVILAVVETEPVVKGQTAASSYKPAIMDNGVRVMVPPFVNQGERVIVCIENRTYSKRAD